MPIGRPVALLLALVGGVAFAVQSRINGALGSSIHDGVAAAAISFGVGLSLLAAFVVSGDRRRGQLGSIRRAVRSGELDWTYLCGGLAGAIAVASQGATVSTIGVAMFTVAVVGGQVVSSMVVDRMGLGPTGRTPISPKRLVGAALVLGAVLLASHSSLTSGTHWYAIAFPVLAGVATAWQSAANGRVAVAGGAAATTLVNFAVGFGALVVIGAVVSALRGLPGPFPHQAWLYVGGALGVVGVGVAATVVRVLGVLVLGLGMIAGQLFGAVILDEFVPAHAAVTGTVIAACVLAFTGVLVGAARH